MNLIYFRWWYRVSWSHFIALSLKRMWPFSDHQGVRDWHAPCYHHIRRRFNSHKSVVTSPAYLLLRLLSPLDSIVCRYFLWLNFNQFHSRYKKYQGVFEGGLHWDNWSLNNPSRSILSDIVSRLWMSEWTMEWGKKGDNIACIPAVSFCSDVTITADISDMCPHSPHSCALSPGTGLTLLSYRVFHARIVSISNAV